MDGNSSSYWDHLEELRRRLAWILIWLTAAFLLLWAFRNDLLNIYLLPLKEALAKSGGEVVLLRIMDKFMVHLRTCFFFAVILTVPFAVFQFWRFVAPGLYPREKRGVGGLLWGSLGLFYLGVATAYFLVIPLGFRFLVHYSDGDVGLLTSLVVDSRLTLSLSEQVAFTQRFLLVFGFVFQTPLLMALLSRLGLLSATFFARYRRHALVLCFVAAAVLTPPDPLTMVGLAMPLVLLYEVGIQLSRLVGGKTPPPGKAEESGV